MNCSIYIFGEQSSGYVQFPEDTAANVLKTLYNNCKATTQIITHRDNNILYYCYIRKVSDNAYIGISIAVNGYYILQIKPLFTLFEKAIESLAERGIFIHFNDNGELTTQNNNINKDKEEINHFINYLRVEFEKLNNISKPLPPTDYTIAKDSIIELSLNDNKTSIIQAIYSHGFTYIYKESDYNTVRLNSYQSILKRINEENTSLKKSNKELKEKNEEISRQKNKYQTVITLSVFIVCAIITICLLYNSITSKEESITFLNEQLEITRTEISEKESLIQNQNYKIEKYINDIEELCKYEHTVGAIPMFKEDGPFDNQWGEWMYAECSLTITSFYIYADKEGNIDIELYDSTGTRIDKTTVYTKCKTAQKISCNFNLDKGYYFMRIKPNANNAVSLHYHSSSSKEYSYYSNGALRLTGASSVDNINKSDSRTKTGYYQYFYQISYRINSSNN